MRPVRPVSAVERTGILTLHRPTPTLPRAFAIGPSGAAAEATVAKFAAHLKSRFGRPSIRFALSRLDIFPPDAKVPLAVLQRVCDVDQLRAIFEYVSGVGEVCDVCWGLTLCCVLLPVEGVLRHARRSVRCDSDRR